jgi:hypothetical protein
MWIVCFKELRALTNTKQLSLSGLNVNPMELSDIYEHVWNLGVVLQTEECLSILQADFRPWPKVATHPSPTLPITPVQVVTPFPVYRCAWQKLAVWSFTVCWRGIGQRICPDDQPVTVPVHTQNHYCLSIFCFCVLLVILNLLFLQWLFYKVRNVNAK